LKAVLLARLEESLLESGGGGGEEEAPAEETPPAEEEEAQKEKEATPEPESAPVETAAPAAAAAPKEEKKPNAAANAKAGGNKNNNNNAEEEGELTKEQKDELKKKKREEFKAIQKAEYEAREAKRQAKKAEENRQFIETLEERAQRAAKFNGPFILSDAEKRRVRECGAAAKFGLPEQPEAKPAAPAVVQKSAEEKKQIEAEREAKKRARMERFGAEALKPLHPPPQQNANKKAKLGGAGGAQDRNLTNYTI
jgi:fused signal recognition particle receptor